MRRFIILATAALSLSACATGGSPVTYSKPNKAVSDAEWARNNAHADEQIRLHQEAVAKWQANRAKELQAEEARQLADPAYQAEHARRQQAQAADAQCGFAAQQAYMQVDVARPSLLGLEAVGYRNMTYRSCMQAHGYAISGGSGGPAPTLSDLAQ